MTLLGVFALLALAGCAAVQQEARPVPTPPAYRATMDLPGQFDLSKALMDLQRSTQSSSSDCVASGDIVDLEAGRTSVVLGYFDDALVRDAGASATDWAELHAISARSGRLLVGGHNRTDALPVAITAVPRADWPAGAGFCGRVDWEGPDKARPDFMTRSREYTCYRDLPGQGGYQFVQLEFVEYRPEGWPPAAMDPRATADAVFASLRLGGA